MSPLQLERRVARKHLAGEYFFQDPKVLFALQRGSVVSCHCLAANCPWTGKERFGEHVYHLHLSCSVVLEICGRIMTNYSFETKYENCFVNLE